LWVLFLVVFGCGRSPELSQSASEYTVAIYSACSVRNMERLEAAAVQLAESRREDLLESERVLLSEIMAEARAGEWTSAVQRCRTLLNAQRK